MQFALARHNNPGCQSCVVATRTRRWPISLQITLAALGLLLAFEALSLLPRIPTLRAHRLIRKGEEILFNYGSSLPFFKKPEDVPEDVIE